MLSRRFIRPFVQARGLNYFKLFPQTFPNAHESDFDIDQTQLRKEYIQLQQQVHPDVARDGANSQVSSAEISNAYRELRNPFKRATHILQLYNQNPFEEVMDDNMELVMRVMELQEDISMCKNKDELDEIRTDVDAQVSSLSKKMSDLLKNRDFKNAKPVLQELQYLSKVTDSIDQMASKLA